MKPQTNRKPRLYVRISALLCTALMLIAGSLVAQTTSSTDDAVDLFGEIIDVKVVNLEVVVTDRQGRRVTDLEPGDFRLYVDGRETEIDYFSEVREGQSLASDRSQPPGAEAGAAVGTNFLLYVDDNHSFKHERDVVVRNLMEDLSFLGPQDRLAIVAQSGTSLVTLSNWSNSRVELRAALARLLDASEFGGTLRSPVLTARRTSLDSRRAFPTVDQVRPSGPSVPRFASELPSAGEGRFLGNPADLPIIPGFDQFRLADNYAQRIDLELAMSGALSTLRGFQAPQGRKVMMLLTGDWPIGNFAENGASFNTLTEFDVLEPLIETANLLGYTLYPINDRASDSVWRNASFNRVAQRTGGRALFRRADVLADIKEDTRSYYWLGFAPELRGSDRRHQIEILVDRPGLKVRSRNSYLDLSRNAQLAMNTQGALLFETGQPANGLQLEFGTPQAVGLRKMEVPVTVLIPLDQLTAIDLGDLDQVQLELRFAVVDSTGAQAAVPRIPITLRGEVEDGDLYAFETQLRLRRGPHQIAATVYDPGSGQTLLAKDVVRYRM